MDCSVYREAASAQLDGEALGMSAEALAAHLDECADCAAFVAQAVDLNRQARIRQAAVPDLSASILAAAQGALPSRRRRSPIAALRIALGVIAVAQLAMSAPALLGDRMGMAMSTHAAHESAAWNLAIGVGFLVVALAPRRAAAALPIAGTFVLVLSVLSIPDWLDGAVGADRLATHLAAVAGVLVMLGLARYGASSADAPPGARSGGVAPGARLLGAGGDADDDSEDGEGGRRLRGVA